MSRTTNNSLVCTCFSNINTTSWRIIYTFALLTNSLRIVWYLIVVTFHILVSTSGFESFATFRCVIIQARLTRLNMVVIYIVPRSAGNTLVAASFGNIFTTITSVVHARLASCIRKIISLVCGANNILVTTGFDIWFTTWFSVIQASFSFTSSNCVVINFISRSANNILISTGFGNCLQHSLPWFTHWLQKTPGAS